MIFVQLKHPSIPNMECGGYTAIKQLLGGGQFADCTELRENKLSSGAIEVGLMYCLQDLQLR
jgi:hypothetical protein